MQASLYDIRFVVNKGDLSRRCVTLINVHIANSALSLTLLSQRCARFHCHNAVLIFVCTSVSNRCRIPPV